MNVGASPEVLIAYDQEGFQLFRFEVIGEPATSQRGGYDGKLSGFQLFRFEVIGEH